MSDVIFIGDPAAFEKERAFKSVAELGLDVMAMRKAGLVEIRMVEGCEAAAELMNLTDGVLLGVSGKLYLVGRLDPVIMPEERAVEAEEAEEEGGGE